MINPARLFRFFIGVLFNSPAVNGIFVFILVMSCIGIYAFMLAPVIWVLLSELFSNYIRIKALSLDSYVLWLATFIVVFIPPYLFKLIAVFNIVIFSIFNIIGFFTFSFKLLPYKLLKGKIHYLKKLDVKFILLYSIIAPSKGSGSINFPFTFIAKCK